MAVDSARRSPSPTTDPLQARAPEPASRGARARQAQALLDASEELIAAGRPEVAVDVLQAGNRWLLDGDLERELVRLRVSAPPLPDHDAAPRTWPPEGPDPFPELERGPPEITAKDLDATVLAGAITSHGCVLVRGLLDPAWAGHLEQVTRTVFAARRALRPDPGPSDDPLRDDPLRDDPLRDDLPDDLRRWYDPVSIPGRRPPRFGNETQLRVIDSPVATFEVLDAFEQAGVRQLVHDHFGETPVLTDNKWALRRVRADLMEDFHQDGRFLGDGVRTLNIWLALSACGDGGDAPGLELVPRRIPSVLPTGDEDAWYWWTISPSVAERAAGDGGIVCPRVGPGDAVLFDELLVHRKEFRHGGIPDERLAIESWFFAPSAFNDERYAPIRC